VFWNPTLPSQAPEARRRSLPARSRRWRNCTPTIRKQSGWRFRQARQLFARQVDRMTSNIGVRNPAHSEFEKLPSGCRRPSATGAVSILRRLPPRQHDLSCHRAAGAGGTGLGTVDARRSMADFTYLLMQWTMPGLAGPTSRRSTSRAWKRPRKSTATSPQRRPDLNWYFAYNLFRLAGITQGIAGSCFAMGTAANVKAMESASARCRCRKLLEYAQKAARSETRGAISREVALIPLRFSGLFREFYRRLEEMPIGVREKADPDRHDEQIIDLKTALAAVHVAHTKAPSRKVSGAGTRGANDRRERGLHSLLSAHRADRDRLSLSRLSAFFRRRLELANRPKTATERARPHARSRPCFTSRRPSARIPRRLATADRALAIPSP